MHYYCASAADHLETLGRRQVRVVDSNRVCTRSTQLVCECQEPAFIVLRTMGSSISSDSERAAAAVLLRQISSLLS
jgi:hypothetical protein